MHTFDIHFSELAALYKQAVRGEQIVSRSHNHRWIVDHVRSWKRENSFYGISSEEMISYIDHGYRVEGLSLVPALPPIRNRRKMFMNDLDGDFQYDLWKSGEDLYFVDFTPREAVPTMNFRFGLNFAATADEMTIRAYQSWLLKAILALEESGIDCSIAAQIVGLDTLGGNYPLTQNIEVKRAGEPMDFAVWSAMFAPSSYRHMGFLSYVIGADRLGYNVKPSLGKVPQTRDYYCEFDSDSRSIVAHCAARGNPKFFEKAMTDSFRAAVDQAKKSVQ
jgi:hypothetical protein